MLSAEKRRNKRTTCYVSRPLQQCTAVLLLQLYPRKGYVPYWSQRAASVYQVVYTYDICGTRNVQPHRGYLQCTECGSNRGEARFGRKRIVYTRTTTRYCLVHPRTTRIIYSPSQAVHTMRDIHVRVLYLVFRV